MPSSRLSYTALTHRVVRESREPLVARLAEFSPDRQAGNRTCLASEGISALLDMEESATTPWKT